MILFKFLTREDKTVYVKVKVSQGFWWASTLKPSLWLADSIKKGDTEVSLSGKPIVTILQVRKYPVLTNNITDQYDVFLHLKLEAGYNQTTKKYSFKRSNLTIGSPIEFEFNNTAITATIVNISDKPIKDIYVEKTVTLQKNLAQELEFNAITKGDEYWDGEATILKILEKNMSGSYDVISSLGNYYPVVSDKRTDITVTMKMKLMKIGDKYLYREELPLIKGRHIDLSTSHSVLMDFVVTDIQ